MTNTMRRSWSYFFCILVVAVIEFLLLTSVRASDVTLGIIGPHEYDLPVDFKPFNVFVQYGNGNAAGMTYDRQGVRQPRGGSHTWSGMSKYVHFRSFDAIPHVGFAFELIQTESYSLANGKDFGGLGPTIIGPAAWFKPNKSSTFGIQTFMQTPRGTRDALSTNYWANISSFIFDYEWKNFSFDGDLGAVLASTKHVKNEHSYKPGSVFFSNLRLGWKATYALEPFFAFDWQNAGGLYDNTLGQSVHGTSSHEIALGAGTMWTVNSHLSLTARYSHSVEARNTPESNAYYLKMTYLWQ